MIDFDFKKLDSWNFTEQTYEIEQTEKEDVQAKDTYILPSDKNSYEVTQNIKGNVIDDIDCDISVLSSDSHKCKIVSILPESARHEIILKADGTLTVNRIGLAKWYEQIGFNLGENSLTIYLPRGEYDTLEIISTSGDVSFPSADFGEIMIETVSGDVKGTFLLTKNFEIETISGDISVAITEN